MTPTVFTPTELAKVAEREVAQRRRVYPRLVSVGRMTKAAADREIAAMERIAADYRERAAADPARDGRLL